MPEPVTPLPTPQGPWRRLWNSSKAWQVLLAALGLWFAPYSPEATKEEKAQSEQTRLMAIASLVIANVLATAHEDKGAKS